MPTANLEVLKGIRAQKTFVPAEAEQTGSCLFRLLEMFVRRYDFTNCDHTTEGVVLGP